MREHTTPTSAWHRPRQPAPPTRSTAYDTDDILYRLTTLVQIAGALILAAGVPRPHPLDPRTNRCANRLASTPRTGEDGDR